MSKTHEVKREYINVEVDPRLKVRVKAMAQKKGLTLAELTSRILKAAVIEFERKPEAPEDKAPPIVVEDEHPIDTSIEDDGSDSNLALFIRTPSPRAREDLFDRFNQRASQWIADQPDGYPVPIGVFRADTCAVRISAPFELVADCLYPAIHP